MLGCNPRQFESNLGPGLGVDLLVRRLAGGHQDHAFEPELESSLVRQHQVADVRRVERTTEYAEL